MYLYGHVAEQEGGWMLGLGLPFFVPSGTRAHGKTHPRSGRVFLPQLNLSGNTLTNTPRGAFPRESKSS